MSMTRPPYPSGFREQMVDLVRSGRSPEDLAREFEPSAQSIRNWVDQADRDAGRGDGGLTSGEREELQRFLCASRFRDWCAGAVRTQRRLPSANRESKLMKDRNVLNWELQTGSCERQFARGSCERQFARGLGSRGVAGGVSQRRNCGRTMRRKGWAAGRGVSWTVDGRPEPLIVPQSLL